MEEVRGVAVVIVTYNGARWIADCLKSLSNSSVACTIIVVDNCSSDHTVELITNEFSNVVLIRNAVNNGFGQANNIGIIHALRMNMDYILLLNQDTTVQPHAIALLVDSIAGKSDRFAVVSPMHLNDIGSGLDDGFRNFLKKSLDKSEIDRLVEGVGDKIVEIDFVNAAAWLIPADVFRKVGGFAPLFFHYGEDRDFVNRIRFHGYRIGVLPNSRIQHYRGNRKPLTEWKFEKKVHYYYVNWLSRATDIRTGLLSAFFSGLTWVCKESLFYLIKGSPTVAAASMVASGRMVRSLRSIISHRKTVKHAGVAHYLEIDKTEQTNQTF
jgi:GT2 family glycosyltransferase